MLAVLHAAPSPAAAPCADGVALDVMVASHHIRPTKQLDEFNPGLGVECVFHPEWAATAGYFRNSLDRPSFYAGAIYTPELLHRGWARLGVMGGIISGYNYGRFGVGPHGSTGPVLAPAAMARVGRVGLNFILIPPIPQDHLPFTIGFQARYALR